MHFYTLANYLKKETISFIIEKKTIKYLGITLKRLKDLYTENCKALMKETEDDTHKWKEVSCSLIKIINIVEMSVLSKAVYRFNATIPIKIPMAIFHRKRKKS